MTDTGGCQARATDLHLPPFVEQIALGQPINITLFYLRIVLPAVSSLSNSMFVISSFTLIVGYITIFAASFGDWLTPTFEQMQVDEQLGITPESRPSPVYLTETPAAAPRLQDYAATAVLLAFAAIACWYAAVIPAGEGVDEIPHYLYVLYVKEQKALPIQPMTREDGVDVWMGHHPPLYYAFGAAAVSAINTSDANVIFVQNPHFKWRENDGRNGWNVFQHFGQDAFPGQGAALGLRVLRLANVILSLVGLLAILLAGRMIFGTSSWLPVGILAFMAFNPSFIFMTATVHHDVLQSAIFAVGILWMVVLLKRDEVSGRYYILGGVLVSAAMLTKLSGAALALSVALAIALKVYTLGSWRRFLTPYMYVFGTVLVLSGWWYIRNWALYGDPLGWQMFLTLHRSMVRRGPYTLEEFRFGFLGQIGRTFWGAFGYMHITFPKLTRGFRLLTGVALLGFVLALINGRLQLRRSWKLWLLLTTLLALLFASFVRFSMATVGAGHARYLFPALFAIGVVIVIGFNELTNWHSPSGVSLALAGALAFYSIWLPITLVLPKYAPPETLAIEELPPQAKEVKIELGESLMLAAYDVNLATGHVWPGESVPITLYWQAKGERNDTLEEQYIVALVDQTEVLFSYSDWPVPGLSPENWRANTLYPSHAVIATPDENFSSPLQIVISTTDGETDKWSESPAALGTITVTTESASVTPDFVPNRQSVIFGDQIALRGFDLMTSTVTAGSILPVESIWQVKDRPQAEFTVFVHVIDDEGELVAQCDSPLGSESQPTTEWARDGLYSHICRIEMPAELPAGEYSLRVGLYTWPSLERLLISNNQGDQPNSFMMASVTVADK